MKDPVKEKIQQLVPEVMELKFGCEVMYYPEDLKVRVHLVYWALKAFRGTADKDGTNVRQFLIKDCIILGSPITLPIVLRAIKKTGRSISDFSLRNDIILLLGNLPESWNLLKDYDDQSEELKAFLGKILEV